MEAYESKTTTSKHGKEYDHKRYHCRTDDVWGRMEVPKEPAIAGSENKNEAGGS